MVFRKWHSSWALPNWGTSYYWFGISFYEFVQVFYCHGSLLVGYVWLEIYPFLLHFPIYLCILFRVGFNDFLYFCGIAYDALFIPDKFLIFSLHSLIYLGKELSILFISSNKTNHSFQFSFLLFSLYFIYFFYLKIWSLIHSCFSKSFKFILIAQRGFIVIYSYMHIMSFDQIHPLCCSFISPSFFILIGVIIQFLYMYLM
jgi:hypothetical protein